MTNPYSVEQISVIEIPSSVSVYDSTASTVDVVEVGVLGPQGVTGDTGPANTLTIGTVSGGTSASATITGTAPNQTLNLVLPKGDTGEQGPQGERGLTGATGATGDTGPKGDTGEKGDKGDTGLTGATGPAGATGAKGDKGDTGAEGPQGIQGPTGPQGPQGPKGDTGSTGPAGDKGDTGDTGATGAQGPSGVIGVDVGELTNTGTSTSAQLGLADAGTAGTYTKVTTDQFGRVTAGTTLSASDIPTITSGQVSGLAASATTDTTNASYISSGTLSNSRLSGVALTAGGNTFTGGKQTLPAATTSYASLNIPSIGPSTVTSPATGDVWLAGTSTMSLNFRDTSATRIIAWNDGSNLGTGAVSSTNILDGTIVNGDINASAAIAATKISGTAYTYTDSRTQNFQTTSFVETIPRIFVSSANSMVNGQVRFSHFTPMTTTTITQIAIATTTAGTDTGGTTVRRLGLYTVSGTTYTLVARIDSDSTIGNSANTVYTRSLSTTGGYPSSYTLTAGTTYAIGAIMYNTGGTFASPSFFAVGGGNGTIQALSPIMTSSLSTQTDLPTSTSSTTAGTGVLLYARFS